MNYIHRTTTVLLLLLAFASNLVAQNVKVNPDIIYTAERSRYVLGGLTIDPIKDFDEELLLGLSGLEVGKTYEIPGSDISQAIRNYWKHGFFSSVKIEADSIVGNKIYLHVKLGAQPRISSIKFNGLKKSDRTEIEKRIPLRVGNQITPNLVDRAKLRIRRYFEEKGYKNAKIEVIQREDVTADNKMLVEINVDRSQKVRVHRIFITGIEGDEKISSAKAIRKIKNAMKKTNEPGLLNIFKSKKFVPEKYEEDKGLAIDKLNSWGFRDALIVKDSVANFDDNHVDVYIHFYQGKKYYVRNIDWVGNTVYPSEALANVLRLKRGDVYNQTLLRKRLNEDEDAIGQQYYNSGYVFYNLDPVEINVDGDSIDLQMRITEGRQATYNRIRISGNDRVYEHVIRRELRTKPGDLFSMDAIQRSVRELASMNQFDPEALQSEISKNIKPDPSTGTVDITYPLVHKGGDQVELSAGWGQTGIVGRIGLKFTNFSIQNLFGGGYKRAGFIPQGDGQTFSLSGQTNGTYYQSYSLQFVDPWFGRKRPNQFQFSLFYSKQSDINTSYYNDYSSMYSFYYGMGSNSSFYNYDNYYDPDKYVKLFGVSVGFGKRLRWPDDYFTFMADLSYTRYTLKNWRYFLIQNGTCNNINLTLTLGRSSTDNGFFPRRGSDFSISVTATPPYSLFDGKDYSKLATNPASSTYGAEAQEKYKWIEYYKFRFKFNSYTALTGSQKHCPVIRTRAEFGLLGHYDRNKRSPFETYYVGGDGMSGYNTGYATETVGLRGYGNGSIAGANYDNAYAYTRLTLELRYPIMLEPTTSIYALAFLEAGNAWADMSDFNPFKLKKSAGIGVRIQLPMVGLMGLDWAYGFQVHNELGQKIGGSQFHFVIGQEF